MLAGTPTDLQPVPQGIGDEIKKLIPFCPDIKHPTVVFKEGCVSTQDGEQSAEIGFECAAAGIYNIERLLEVLAVATYWDPTTYPRPVFFKGDKIQGLIVGIRT